MTRPRFTAANPLDLIATAAAAALAGALLLLITTSDAVEEAGAVALIGALAVPLLYPAPVRERIALAIALVGAWAVTVALLTALPDLINPAPSVSQAVGGAVFAGIEYQGRGIALAISFALLVAVAVAGLAVRRDDAVTEPAAPAEDRTVDAGGSNPGWWLAAITLLVAFTVLPSAADYFPVQRPLIPSWDTSNLELWDYLASEGAVAMRDFFFPYGGQWVFALIPEGPLLRWGTQVAMLGFAAWALCRLGGRDVLRVGACLLALTLIATWNPFVWRFLPGFLIPLAYAAIAPATGRLTGNHLVFGLVCLFTGLYEADLLLYGVAGCALVLLGDLVGGTAPRSPRRLAPGLVLDAIPVVVAVAATVGVWAVTDTLEGNLDFFGHLGATTVSGAVQIEQTFELAPTVDSIYVALPALLAVGGLAMARAGRRAAGVLLLAAAGFTLIFALKHLVRPVDKLPLIAMVAGSWVAILLWRPRGFGPTFAAALLAAALIVTLQNGRALTAWANVAVESPVRLFELGRTAIDADRLEEDAEEHYVESTYARFQENGVAAEFRAAAARPDGTVPSFAVLGDAPLLYVFFDQKPPFHDQLYDAAPLFQQERMVESLEEIDPQLLVWRQQYAIDELPYQVRDPIVFEWAIRNYVPLEPKTADEFSFVDVLRRRRADEPIASRFWQASLGTMELGYIPSYSAADELPACDEGRGCAPVAVLEHDGATPGELVGVQVTDAEGEQFAFNFRVREGVGSYPVRLDRLWFWPLVDGEPQLVAAAEGWSVEIVEVDGSDDLY